MSISIRSQTAWCGSFGTTRMNGYRGSRRHGYFYPLWPICSTSTLAAPMCFRGIQGPLIIHKKCLGKVRSTVRAAKRLQSIRDSTW